MPTVSRGNPVRHLSTGRSVWRCDGATRVLDGFRMTSWLVVSPDVRTIRQRYWVDDVPGPWFTTRAQNGFAHLQTWLRGPEPAGTSYSVEYRVLDAQGVGRAGPPADDQGEAAGLHRSRFRGNRLIPQLSLPRHH